VLLAVVITFVAVAVGLGSFGNAKVPGLPLIVGFPVALWLASWILRGK
jgi:hypothetical protein